MKTPLGSTDPTRNPFAACPFLAASHRGGIFVVPRGGGPNDLPPPHPSPRRAYCLDQSSNPSPSPVSRVVGSARRSRVTGRRFFTRTARAAEQGEGCFLVAGFWLFFFCPSRSFVRSFVQKKIYTIVRTIARSVQKKSRNFFSAMRARQKKNSGSFFLVFWWC